MRTLTDLAALAIEGRQTLCKCCGCPAPFIGRVDFNRSCEDGDGQPLPPSGVLVPYYRCGGCGFLFTRFFDHWTHGEFQAHIYNEDYPKVDHDFLSLRAETWVRSLGALLGAAFPRLTVLDWGGGTGRLAEGLRAKGVPRAETWDPFTPAFQAMPQGTFNLVTCIEVLEHLPDPRAGLRKLKSFVSEEGGMILSTVLQPEDMAALGTDWWYLAPRNGHISLFTHRALATLLGELHCELRVFQTHIHFAWSKVPFWMLALAPPPEEARHVVRHGGLRAEPQRGQVGGEVAPHDHRG